MGRYNALTEAINTIKDDVETEKNEVNAFLYLFGVEVVKDKRKLEEVFNYENLSSSFNQMFNTREQYIDNVEEFIQHVTEIEEWIKDFKAYRKSMVYNPRWAQSNAHLLAPYATALYRWRNAARRYRRETNEAALKAVTAFTS